MNEKWIEIEANVGHARVYINGHDYGDYSKAGDCVHTVDMLLKCKIDDWYGIVDPKNDKTLKRYCEIDLNGKIIFVIDKDGIYNCNKIEDAIKNYFEKIPIGNGGILKVATAEELKNSIKSLYKSDNVRYVTAIGKPTFFDKEEISFINHSVINSYQRCIDICCSYIYCSNDKWMEDRTKKARTDVEKINAISEMINRFANYHQSATPYLKEGTFILRPDRTGTGEVGHTIPIREISGTSGDETYEEFKKKKILLIIKAHGGPGTITFAFMGEEIFTLRHLYDFYMEYGAPYLLISSYACYYHCMWPEAFLEAGAWCYYVYFGGGNVILNTDKSIGDGNFIGHAIRSSPHPTIRGYDVYGDVLAHI